MGVSVFDAGYVMYRAIGGHLDREGYEAFVLGKGTRLSRRQAGAAAFVRARRAHRSSASPLRRQASAERRRTGGFVRPFTTSRRGALLPTAMRVQREQRVLRGGPGLLHADYLGADWITR